MVKEFYKDLAQAKNAEKLVRDVFSSLTFDYQFIDVSEQREYYKKGDIKAVDKDGKEIMIEVKNDSRIAETHNVLCEEQVFYYDICDVVKGNFYNDYEIYCVVSQEERKIYVMDFSILKKYYKRFPYQEIKHSDQITYCYLFALSAVRKLGGMIAEVDF